jgi:sterol 3beta-glucosyltransferase
VSRAIQAGDNLAFFRAASAALQPMMESHLDSMRAASEGADLVISSPVTEFTAAVAAEACGAKFALSYLVPMAPSSHYAPFVLGPRSLGMGCLNRLAHGFGNRIWWSVSKREITRLRARWGLKPQAASSTSLHRKSGGLELFGFSPTLFPKPADWTASQHVCGAWQLPATAGEVLGGDDQDPGFVQWLEDGSPPVYFGFGSMPVPDHEGFLEMAAELCEEIGMRALIGAGWNDINMKACDLPDNLAIVESVDHAWLFPHCAAVVHHGGAGTTHAALAAGVPSLIASFFADQPFWGRSIKALGAGHSMRFQDMSYDTLKRALEMTLEEAVVQRAAEMGALLKNENGTLAAVNLLERA